MKIDTQNNWPLTVYSQPAEKMPMKQVPHPPSQNSQTPIILNPIVELKPGTYWEKGIYIDIFA